MQNFLELPNELLLRIAQWCTITSLGRLAQTSRKGLHIFEDDTHWKARINTELTNHPMLRPNQTYRNYYEIMYDFQKSASSTFGHYTDDNNYKCFLTKSFAEDNSDDITAPAPSFSLRSYLISACTIGAEIWAEQLISMGADINRIYYDDSLIMLAARNGHLPTINLLLHKGIDINFTSESLLGRSSVFHESLRSLIPTECIKMLLAFAVKNSIKIRIFRRLHLMVLFNLLEPLKSLLDSGVDIDGFDCAGLSALGWAILLNRVKCASLLLSYGAKLETVANFDHVQHSRYSFNGAAHGMMLAIEKKNALILKIILDAGIDPNEVLANDSDFDDFTNTITPLELAVKKNFIAGVQLLLRAGASSGFSQAYCDAAASGYLQSLMLMTRSGMNVNFSRKTVKKDRKFSKIAEDTPLTLATQYGHTECIAVLLHAKANPNIKAIHQDTHHPSGQNKNHPLARTDIEEFFPIMNAVHHLLSITNRHQGTALLAKTIVTSYTFFDDREYLIRQQTKNDRITQEFGSNDYNPVDKKNLLSDNALQNLHLLLRAGANPNTTNSLKQTPLSLLINGIRSPSNILIRNHNKLISISIEMLVHHGAKCSTGQLHSILKTGKYNFSLLKFLVEKAGADIFEVDADGHTPLAIAKDCCPQRIIQYLIDKEYELNPNGDIPLNVDIQRLVL